MSCEVCGSIGELKTIATKQYDASFNLTGTIDGDPPGEFPQLEQVSASVRRCPRCGAHFRWTETTVSLQGGPECQVEETLRRIALDVALEIIATDGRHDPR